MIEALVRCRHCGDQLKSRMARDFKRCRCGKCRIEDCRVVEEQEGDALYSCITYTGEHIKHEGGQNDRDKGIGTDS